MNDKCSDCHGKGKIKIFDGQCYCSSMPQEEVDKQSHIEDCKECFGTGKKLSVSEVGF